MPSEVDPLLPKGNSAPEITGYGFSKPSSDLYHPSTEEIAQEEEPCGEPSNSERQIEGPPSPLRTFIGLFAVVVTVAIVITIFTPGILDHSWDPSWKPWGPKPSTVEARVKKILTKTPLIDGHNDLAILIYFAYHNDIYSHNFTEHFEQGPMPYHVDLPRLKSGRIGGSFWSAFTPCPANGSDFSSANYAPSVSMTLKQLDLLHRLTEAYPQTFSNSLLNSTNALVAFKDRNLLISPIGIEGLHQIGNSYSNLRLYHELGVKYATLTHNCHNAFADAALVPDTAGSVVDAPPYWNGLSPKGSQLIREMNRMGMLVDLSHVSKATMLDVLGANPHKGPGSAAPVIFSHSSAYALCPHPRNVQDDVLQLVKSTNSIVMVNFSPEFISCLPVSPDSKTGVPDFYPPNSTLHQVAKHITYIGDFIGYDHVGLGSDFDGIFSTPRGLEDVSKFPDLIAELLRMGVSDQDAAKIVGGNVLRVWGDSEKVALKLQRSGVLPAEDKIEINY